MDKNTDDFKLQEIINGLIDTDVSLYNPLMKLYYLGKLIDNQELIEYTHKEINGYDMQDNIPDYRKARTRLFANVYNRVNGNENCVEIPNSVFKKEIQNLFEELPICNGIREIEEMEKASLEKKKIGTDLPLECNKDIQAIINYGEKNKNWHVQKAQLVANLESITSNIRTKLLDFVMEIGEKFGMNVEVNTFKKSTDTNNKTINNIMNTTIYNNGDGNFTNTGNSNSITNSINIVKNDFESLKKELKKLNIEDKEIENLEQILSREKPNNNELGNETKGWISKIIDNFGISVTAEFLASMIKSFFGIAG